MRRTQCMSHVCHSITVKIFLFLDLGPAIGGLWRQARARACRRETRKSWEPHSKGKSWGGAHSTVVCLREAAFRKGEDCGTTLSRENITDWQGNFIVHMYSSIHIDACRSFGLYKFNGVLERLPWSVFIELEFQPKIRHNVLCTTNMYKNVALHKIR